MATKSQQLFERAIRTTASNRADLEATLPDVFDYGEGAYVVDLDGRRYLDFTASSGAILLGYGDSRVTDSVCAELRRGGGLLPSTLSPLQVDLAERLCSIFPCAERAIFFKTGSCATTAAIRLARLHTGREIVLTSGYHGWHDWQLTLFPRFRRDVPDVFDFRYNLNRLEQMITENPEAIACVIITPEPNFFEPEYLAELRDITRRHNIVLIFDEVVSGFRYGLGGYQAVCGITPDLTTISKGLANGHALSAVVGRSDIVEQREATHLVGTFHHDRAPFAAALASLDALGDGTVYQDLFSVGRHLVEGINAIFAEAGLAAEAFRHPGLFHVLCDDEVIWQEIAEECRTLGVLFHPFDPQMITFAHTYSDIEIALAVLRSAIANVRRRNPDAFGNRGSRPGREALNHRTLHEFGGLVDYRLPTNEVLDTWPQDDR